MQTNDDELDLTRAISLTEAAKLMRGRGGKRPSVETVRRWANPKKGCWPQGRGEGRRQLLLRVVRLNGEMLTSETWVRDFELARARLGARPQPDPRLQLRTPRQREAAQRRARERLARDGI